MNKTALIILNYNSSKNVEKILELSKEHLNKEIIKIVVDNSSDFSDLQKLNQLKKRFQFILMEKKKNTGYASGNNVGIRYARSIGCKYLCILNCDIIFNADFLTPCINYLREHKDVAFVGPAILNMDNHLIQSTGGRINLFTGDVSLINYEEKINTVGQMVECDYLSGACLVFKTDILSEVGLIPTNYFLFFEETEWCYIAKRRGYKNICLTNSRIYHEGSNAINKVSGLHSYLMERNRVVFEKRNTRRKYEYVFFLFYIYSRAIFNILKGKTEYLSYIKYYTDGALMKISKKFPFITIEDIDEDAKIIK